MYRKQLKQAEEIVKIRSQAAEGRWCLDKFHKSSIGTYIIPGILLKLLIVTSTFDLDLSFLFKFIKHCNCYITTKIIPVYNLVTHFSLYIFWPLKFA